MRWQPLFLALGIVPGAVSIQPWQDPVGCLKCKCRDDASITAEVCPSSSQQVKVTLRAGGVEKSRKVDRASNETVREDFPSGAVEARPSSPGNEDWGFVLLSGTCASMTVRCHLPTRQ